MLKINVGLSRKVSQDYQSKGYSLNIEGELPSEVLNDQRALAEATNNLFALANRLLDDQVQNTTAPESTPMPTSRRVNAPTYGRVPNGQGRTMAPNGGYPLTR